MKQELQITGKLIEIFDTVDIGTSGYQKRECVVETEENGKKQTILVQFSNPSLIASFNIGDNVRIDFNLNGRLWISPKGEKVYFNTIQGWKIANIQPDYNASAK